MGRETKMITSFITGYVVGMIITFLVSIQGTDGMNIRNTGKKLKMIKSERGLDKNGNEYAA
jgi:hypothetical protein